MQFSIIREYLNAMNTKPHVLNPQSPIPLYRQLADILSAKIRSGDFPVASRIPSENDLAVDYGIGRPTARQATEFLIRKGLLQRKRGSGTYVCARTNEVDLLSLGGTLSAFQKEGIEVETRMREGVKRIQVPKGADNPFSGRDAFFISRLSSVEKAPVLLEEMYLNASLFPDMEFMDLSGKSISRIIEDFYYMKPSSGKQTFRVGTPGSERALQLGISPRHGAIDRTGAGCDLL